MLPVRNPMVSFPEADPRLIQVASRHTAVCTRGGEAQKVPFANSSFSSAGSGQRRRDATAVSQPCFAVTVSVHRQLAAWQVWRYVPDRLPRRRTEAHSWNSRPSVPVFNGMRLEELGATASQNVNFVTFVNLTTH